MTLTKPKQRRTATHHKKRTAQHHKRSHHYAKAYWPYLPMVLIVSLGIVLNSWIGGLNRDVLGYATNMSVSGLLAGTNEQRVANGLGSLALNSKLNSAAQAKAQHMMDNDYWAHVSPDGVTPWYWITNAGYSYLSAGENLAYGFATSSDTITGWMNSPGHRANILGASYKEVGFGIINAPNYQSSGPQTIVVAMYGEPYAAAPAPTPAPTPTPAPAATQPVSEPAPVAETPTPAPEPVATEPVTGPTEADTEVATPENTKTESGQSEQIATGGSSAQTASEKQISRVELLNAANVSWSQFAMSMIASVALLIFLLRHSVAWHKVLVKGEQFVLHHPVLDIAFVTIVTLAVILLQTSGTIK